jgi:signal transduction histidine kinase
MNAADLSTGSLRLRFLLAVMLWVALGVGGIWFTATRVFERHIELMYHEELEVHVRELARLTEYAADGSPRLSRPLSDPRYEVPLSGFYWQVSVPGHPPMRSQSMTRGTLDEDIAHAPDILHTLEGGPTGPAITYGLLERNPDGEEVHFVIATDQSELDEDIDEFTGELTGWLLALAALLLATGVVIIGFGLRPLGRLGEAINRLRSGKAGALEGRYPTEIAPLVSDLNDYVRQNSAIVARARVQAGNLAHSLRTPLAILTDEAEQLARQPAGAPAAQVLLTQAEAMQQQIDYQLARARSSAGARVPGTRASLPDLTLPILNAMRRLHRDRSFVLAPESEPMVLAVDPVNLSELLSILLDNAGKWARREVTLCAVRQRDGSILVSVRDDGPGMPPEQIARACEVGTRFDPERAGSGLGLAMARDLTEDIGATLELRTETGGFTANIRFPADAADHLGAHG